MKKVIQSEIHRLDDRNNRRFDQNKNRNLRFNRNNHRHIFYYGIGNNISKRLGRYHQTYTFNRPYNYLQNRRPKEINKKNVKRDLREKLIEKTKIRDKSIVSPFRKTLTNQFSTDDKSSGRDKMNDSNKTEASLITTSDKNEAQNVICKIPISQLYSYFNDNFILPITDDDKQSYKNSLVHVSEQMIPILERNELKYEYDHRWNDVRSIEIYDQINFSNEYISGMFPNIKIEKRKCIGFDNIEVVPTIDFTYIDIDADIIRLKKRVIEAQSRTESLVIKHAFYDCLLEKLLYLLSVQTSLCPEIKNELINSEIESAELFNTPLNLIGKSVHHNEPIRKGIIQINDGDDLPPPPPPPSSPDPKLKQPKRKIYTRTYISFYYNYMTKKIHSKTCTVPGDMKFTFNQYAATGGTITN